MPITVKLDGIPQETATLFKQLFPGKSPEQVAKAAGAIDGSNVVMHPGGQENKGLYVKIYHPQMKATRLFHHVELPNGQKVLVAQHNDMRTYGDLRGNGHRRFAQTIQNLKELGVHSIHIPVASGNSVGALQTGDNGYYTWPRFGFNGQLTQEQHEELPEHIKQQMGDNKDFHSLFSTPEGAAHWKEKGYDSFGLHFDLNDNSEHMKRFKEYYDNRLAKEAAGSVRTGGDRSDNPTDTKTADTTNVAATTEKPSEAFGVDRRLSGIMKQLKKTNDSKTDMSRRFWLKKRWKDLIKGGLADNLSNNLFDKKQLEEGSKIELEHTNNKKLAMEIAKDHLVEDEDYYKKLKKLKLSRITNNKQYAKGNSPSEAHPLIKGFRIEHALRHLTTDPTASSNTKQLAAEVLYNGNTDALAGLNDSLQEDDHPLHPEYNWLNAAWKIHLDAAVQEAINAVARHSPRTGESGRFIDSINMLTDVVNEDHPAFTAYPQILGPLVQPAREAAEILKQHHSSEDLSHSLSRHALRHYDTHVLRFDPQEAIKPSATATLHHTRYSRVRYSNKEFANTINSEFDRVADQLHQQHGVADLDAFKNMNKFNHIMLVAKGDPTRASDVATYLLYGNTGEHKLGSHKPGLPLSPLFHVAVRSVNKDLDKKDTGSNLKRKTLSLNANVGSSDESSSLDQAEDLQKGYESRLELRQPIEQRKETNDKQLLKLFKNILYKNPEGITLKQIANAVRLPEFKTEQILNQLQAQSKPVITNGIESTKFFSPVSKPKTEDRLEQLRQANITYKNRLKNQPIEVKKQKLLDYVNKRPKGVELQTLQGSNSFSMPREQLLSVIKEAGLQIKEYSSSRGKPRIVVFPKDVETPKDKITENKLHRLDNMIKLRLEGKSLKEIAAIHNMNKTSVFDILKKGRNQFPEKFPDNFPTTTSSKEATTLSSIKSKLLREKLKSLSDDKLHEKIVAYLQKHPEGVPLSKISADNLYLPVNKIKELIDKFNYPTKNYVGRSKPKLRVFAPGVTPPEDQGYTKLVEDSNKLMEMKNSMKLKDIAKKLGLTVSGVQLRIKKAKKLLKLSRLGSVIKYNKNKASLDFVSALRRVNSKQQDSLIHIAKTIHEKMGLTPSVIKKAIHDTPTVSIANTAQALLHSNYQHAVVAAARYGLLSQSPSLLVFHQDGEGPDALYKINVGGSGEAVRATLDKLGIKQRVLLPTQNGWEVLLFSKDGSGHDNIKQFAITRGGTITVSRGTGEIIGGSETPTADSKARRSYRQIISKAERVNNGNVRQQSTDSQRQYPGSISNAAPTAPAPFATGTGAAGTFPGAIASASPQH